MTDTGNGDILALEEVSARYGSVEVLRSIDLRVGEGEAVALLGANGAGKSTTLRVIAGQLKAARGTVRFRGERMNDRPTHARARDGICLIPEGRAIYRRLSVRENLAMQVGNREVSRAIDLAVATFPDLGRRLDQQAGTMSGGQQQMLAVARAIVSEPSLVLVDEVSFGLAPIVVDSIFEVIGELRSRGVSLLIVEQFVDRALELADRFYVLNKGEVVHEGVADASGRDIVASQYLGATA